MKTISSIIIVLTLSSVCAFSQTGSIKGKVVGKADAEPLVGVNVIVQGTLRGASSDINGEFTIQRAPVGRHTLVFSLVGYNRETLPNVVVAEGVIAEVHVALTSAPLQTEQVVVTASKREQSLQEVPVSISIMDAKDISYRNSTTVDDALRYVPGVNMTEYSVNIRGSSGYSRGVGSRVLMLVDGIPFLTGDTGELNFETIPVGQVERIEVVKGASSALYGSSALGGVINVITKSIADEPQTRIRLYGGIYGRPSFEEWDWGGGDRLNDGQSISHSRRFDKLGMSVLLSRLADDGYRQNDFRRRYNGFLKLRYDLSSEEALTTTFNYMHQRRASFLYWKNLREALVPPDGQQGDGVKSTRFFASSQYTNIMSDELSFNVKGLWFRNDWEDTIDEGANQSKSDVLNAEVQGIWTPDKLNIVTFGIEGSYDNVRSSIFGKRSGAGFAAYAQDELQLSDAVKLTGGARFDFHDLDSLAPVSQVNPKLGIVVTPTLGTTLRGSIGFGFRAPAVAEAFTSTRISGLVIIPNPALKPEKSFSAEIGASHAISDDALLDVALFHSEFRDLIESGFIASGQGQFKNVTKARVQGAEASVKAGFFNRNLLLDLGYTYVYPKDLTKNDLLKYRPRHVAHASLFSRLGFLSAGIDYRFVSRLDRIDEEFAQIIANGAERGSAFVTDFRLSADFSHFGYPITTTLNINNAFQYNYVELIGNMMPPRSFVLVIEAKL
ncbi:MAG: TonB-dependent receptor [Ignavibacteriae bacterium]|nr:TonB-dependent receptor [Ignavibacteriota bacterium]